MTIIGLLEQNTLGNIQCADNAQLQELFRTTPPYKVLVVDSYQN